MQGCDVDCAAGVKLEASGAIRTTLRCAPNSFAAAPAADLPAHEDRIDDHDRYERAEQPPNSRKLLPLMAAIAAKVRPDAIKTSARVVGVCPSTSPKASLTRCGVFMGCLRSSVASKCYGNRRQAVRADGRLAAAGRSGRFRPTGLQTSRVVPSTLRLASVNPTNAAPRDRYRVLCG